MPWCSPRQSVVNTAGAVAFVPVPWHGLQPSPSATAVERRTRVAQLRGANRRQSKAKVLPDRWASHIFGIASMATLLAETQDNNGGVELDIRSHASSPGFTLEHGEK